MKRPLAFRALVLACLLAAPTLSASLRADQNDPRLPQLFERLKATESPVEVDALENRIWHIWMTSDNDEVNRLMAAGSHAMAAQDYRAALAAFDRIVAIAPNFAEGWNKRATVYFVLGDYAASLRDIDRTLALEPRHFGALTGLGLVHSELGEAAAALNAFERALAINPHMPNVRRNVETLRKRIGGEEI